MNSFSDNLKAWLLKPFDPNGNTLQWGLTLGTIIIVALIWAHVVTYFGKAGKAIVKEAV